MASTLDCPKCMGKMEDGFILELANQVSSAATEWVAGAPESSFLTFGIKTSGRQRWPIQSFRCTSCGYLESYAGRP